VLLTSCWYAAEALKSCPTAVDGRYAVAGKALFDAGRFQEAIECLQLELKKSPVPQSYTNLAAAQMQVHLYTECEKSCHQALELNPKFVPAFDALAAIYQRQGRHVDALDNDQKAFKYSSKDAQYLIRMAEDLQELGRYSRSILYLDKALQINANSNDARTHKAVALFEQSRFVLAANLAHLVLESNPTAGQERSSRRILLASLLNARQNDLAVLHASKWLSTAAVSQDSNCALMNMQRLINAFDRENDHKIAITRFFKKLKDKGDFMPNGFNYICLPQMFFYLPCTQEQRIFLATYVTRRYSTMMRTHRTTYEKLIERQPDVYKNLPKGKRLRVGFIGACFHKGDIIALYLLRVVIKFIDNHDSVCDIYLYAVNYQYDDLSNMVR
jgi:tetratricopeptide (TPR) repeat protein